MTSARPAACCLLFVLVTGATLAAAQGTSVADAARQSRSKPKTAKVITDDDLPRLQRPSSSATAGSFVAATQGSEAPSASPAVTGKPLVASESLSAEAEHDDSMPCPTELVQQLHEQQASLNSSLQELEAQIPLQEDAERRRRLEGVARVTAEQIELVRKQLAQAEKSVAKPVKGCPGAGQEKRDNKSENKADADRPKQ